MGDSFDSVNIEDYIVNIKDCLVEYDIKEEKKKKGCIVFKGFIKNSTQAVKIFKRPFSYQDLNQKIRFDNLMKAFNQGVVLADNIFIGQESNQQPWFKKAQSIRIQQTQNKFQRLSDIIQNGELDTQRRQRLFQNLVISLKCLHQIGLTECQQQIINREPHYDICPKNIWIEDSYLVYLRPFKLDRQQYIDKIKENGNTQLFYASPEIYFDIGSSSDPYKKQMLDQPEQVILDIQNDIWGLGCIFAEMFLSSTPLFASQSVDEQAFTYYMVLGIPENEEAYYIREEHHNKLCNQLIQKAQSEDLPILKRIMNKVPQKQSEILTSLLEFHPQNRVNCVNLLKYSFFQSHINYSPVFSPNQSKRSKASGDKLSIFDFSVSQRTNQKVQTQPNQNSIKFDNTHSNQGSNSKNDNNFLNKNEQKSQTKPDQIEQNSINQTRTNNLNHFAQQQPKQEYYFPQNHSSQDSYYTQQYPNKDRQATEKQSQANSANKNKSWWNSDFSESKNDNVQNQQDNNGIFDPYTKSGNKKNKILHVHSYHPDNSQDYSDQTANHHINSQKNQIPLQNSNQKSYMGYQDNQGREEIQNQKYPNYNKIQYQNQQTSPGSKVYTNDSAHKQQNKQNYQTANIQSQRSPDFSVKNENQIPSVDSREQFMYQNNGYTYSQDQLLSGHHSNSNGNFSCNLTPIPHKVYQPSSNRQDIQQSLRERVDMFEQDEFLDVNNKINTKTNNIFESQKQPKFFLSQPQNNSGIAYLQNLNQYIPQQNSYYLTADHQRLLNQSDVQNNSYMSQNQTNKSAYIEYNERIGRLFGKSGNKQGSASSFRGRSTQNLDQNDNQDEDYSCVVEIKVKSLTNLQPAASSEGIFHCKVDIPYIDQQCLSLEGDILFDPQQALNQKKIISTQLDLSQAFSYKHIKQVLGDQPIQIKLFNTNQELYAHAFIDFSFNFLLKNPLVQDELLWQKPVTQWYHLINPEDPNQTYGKIKTQFKYLTTFQNNVYIDRIQSNNSKTALKKYILHTKQEQVEQKLYRHKFSDLKCKDKQKFQLRLKEKPNKLKFYISIQSRKEQNEKEFEYEQLRQWIIKRQK